MNLVSALPFMSRNYLSNSEHRILIPKQIKVSCIHRPPAQAWILRHLNKWKSYVQSSRGLTSWWQDGFLF